LVIVNEPDVWMVNLFDKSGRHMVDRGPTFNAHLPIFEDSSGAKTGVGELEFGKETEFFTKYNASRSPGAIISGRSSERYEVKIGGSTLVLWLDAQSKKPLRVSLIQGRGTQTMEYLSYEDNLKFDPSIFQPPAGITFQESK
jgi:outer membrane lipoprotein-sorting protein